MGSIAPSIICIEDVWCLYDNKLPFDSKKKFSKQFLLLTKDCPEEKLKSANVTLAQSFLYTELKNPMKKTLASIISSLDALENSSIFETFSLALKLVLNCKTSVQDAQVIGDSILACLDNFKTGKAAVHSNFLEIFQFIWENLNFMKKLLNQMPSPQETTIIFTCSQTLLKALNVTLQELADINEEQLSVIFEEIYPLVSWFLQSNCVVLNCKLSAGIAYVNLVRKITRNDISSIINEGHYKDLELLFKSSNLSNVSQLCLWNGLLVSLSSDELVKINPSQFVLIIIFEKLYSLGNLSNEESAVLIAFSRSLLTWTDKTYEILKLHKVPQELQLFFNGSNSNLMEQLFNYVYANWDHTIDSLRHHSKDIFGNVVGFHSLCFNDDNGKFLFGLSEKLLDLPWHCKGKYGALCHLVQIVKAKEMLAIKPNIVEEILLALSELSLAPHVSEFLTVISRTHHNEVGLEEWEKAWLDPLMHCLCYGNKVQKSSAQQYVLPKILQVEPKALQYMVNQLNLDKYENKECSMCVTIACVKTAKSAKIHYSVLKSTNENSNLWKNCLPYESIKLALCHTDEQVRLDALGILCDSSKSTEPFVNEELELLKFFLHYNLNIQSPAFRQKMVSLFKKMLTRMKLNSVIELRKTVKNDNSRLNIPPISDYMNFLNWFNTYLLENLYPESNFPRRCTVLQLLVLLNEIFSDVKDDKSLPFEMKVDFFFSQTLWSMLRDTYENNKESVLQLLKSIPMANLGLEDDNVFNDALQMSLSLASSSRPPDSVTAAYMFRILSQSKLCTKAASKICFIPTEEIIAVPECQIYSLLKILTFKFEEQLALACLSLLQAAANGPLYGIMTCTRSGCNHPQWATLVRKIIVNSLEAGAVVQPVVCNASPEGHLPMDTDPESIDCLQSVIQRAIGRRFTTAIVSSFGGLDDTQNGENLFKVDMIKTRAVTAQMLLLCSWRTHKEVSLLLGLLTESCSVGECGLIEPTKFLEIGNYFTKQLAEIKHRGAFEQAYVGFSKLCHRLWRCEDQELHNLPEHWLNELIEMISENKNKNDTSTGPTRRSAGVPFIMQALLVSEPEATNRRCFKKALPAILDLTEIRFDTENSRIHALNVLRALYRDAHLGEDIMPYVSDGIKAAILGFKSENWGVKNSATLLFTTLMTRVFGVNRSRKEPHKKNCLTGRVFFQRFPELFEFLLSELKIASKKISTKESSTLHPILLLLSRLYPSPVEGSGSYVKLDFFIPFVEECATNSTVWWTRHIASQALVPLLPVEEYGGHLDKCFHTLSNMKTSQNEIHGRLLQILCLLKDLKNLPDIVSKNFAEKSSVWLIQSQWLSSEFNKCETTKLSYLEVINCLLSNFSMPSISQKLLLVGNETRSCASDAWIVKVIISSLMQDEDTNLETVIVSSLSSKNYETQVVVLDFLSWLFDCDNEFRDNRSLDCVPFSRDLDWVSSKRVKDVLNNRLAVSLNLHRVLMLLLSLQETRPWCLAEIYLILSQISPKTTQIPCLNTSINELEKLLDKIQNSTFDDVLVSMLPYSGCLALKIFKHNEITGSLLEILEKWSIFMAESSTPDNSSLCRLAVTQALVANAEIMISTSYGASCLALWDTAVILLQDDEPEIRNGIVNLVVKIGAISQGIDPQFKYPVVSTLAMDLLLSYFVSIHENQNYCLSLLIAWALKCDLNSSKLEDQNDEQPFDKGEMNVFLEEITLTRSTCQKISIFLKNHQNLSNFLNGDLFKLPWLSETFYLNEHSSSLEELFENCANECAGLSQELSTCDLSHIYLCHLVDGICVKLYQRMLLIKVLSPVLGKNLKSIFNTVKETLATWKYRNYFIFSMEDIFNRL